MKRCVYLLVAILLTGSISAQTRSFGDLLSRSILYTAITRAKELLIIVGKAETIAVMTQNAKVGRRYTGLKLRLGKEND